MSGTANLVPFAGPTELATLSARLPGDARSPEHFQEFFAANIRNKSMGRTYYKAVRRFNDW
jgi:hypothetical protein